MSERTPVVERRLRRRRAEARALDLDLVLPVEVGAHLVAVALPVARGERLSLRDAVQVEHAVAHVQRVARHADQPLDERRRRIVAVVGLIRRDEHDDVADASGSCSPGRCEFVNGIVGPYASLLTNSQSPMSSVGIMLPDGMRNASTNSVFTNR